MFWLNKYYIWILDIDTIERGEWKVGRRKERERGQNLTVNKSIIKVTV